MFFLLNAFLLTLAMSIDSLIFGVAYGNNKITVPKLSFLIINLTSAICLLCSLIIGTFFSQIIPVQSAQVISLLILIVLGLIKILDSLIKNLINKGVNHNINFTLFSLKLTLNLYANPEDSDLDCSKSISPKEAIFIAFALSLDGIALGFGAGLDAKLHHIMIIVLSAFTMGCIALQSGVWIGKKIADKTNITWIGGVLLIITAIFKLISF